MSSRTETRPDIPRVVDDLLELAVRRCASDVHVEPTAAGCDVRLRVDGVLETVTTHDVATGRAVVTRLMVMSHLLTYRLDVPQEGRFTFASPAAQRDIELRLA